MRLTPLSFLTCVSLLFIPHTADADEPPFSHYGHRHHEMHKRGVIDKLLKALKDNCCDGGEGGECRVTTTNLAMTKVLIDGIWCDVNPGTHVTTSVTLPDDVEAIACAAKKPNGTAQSQSLSCPAIYCLAGKLGM